VKQNLALLLHYQHFLLEYSRWLWAQVRRKVNNWIQIVTTDRLQQITITSSSSTKSSSILLLALLSLSVSLLVVLTSVDAHNKQREVSNPNSDGHFS
jgi:predicted RNA-binding protein with PIN domain